MKKVAVSDYLRYRCTVRGFNLTVVEEIVKYSDERYFDTETKRMIGIGNHEKDLVLIPYEEDLEFLKPVTVHTISRQQVRFRLNTGRFVYG